MSEPEELYWANWPPEIEVSLLIPKEQYVKLLEQGIREGRPAGGGWVNPRPVVHVIMDIIREHLNRASEEAR